MTEVVSRPCCAFHEDWPQLTQHLVESFPDIPLEEIVGIVNRTRRAEEAFGLPAAEHLVTGEIVVRHQLMQLSGQELTRVSLDPHSRRRGASSSPT